ncbi:hypothetical protein TNCV_2619831 [Trichonephila clavipes]|uniref:Uncharacterized protein n=1 Tax=Trichonephila clavipes TaxID=2585209 RepID=A0A8X6WKH5_TRICX|nr:hypothetical protein TNCV_2619831 [Trichonephila clavipes]
MEHKTNQTHTSLLLCVSCWDTYERREIDEQKHVTQSQKNTYFVKNDDLSIEQKSCGAFHSRRESIPGKSSTSFPEDTFMPYSGFEPEPTALRAECHNHHSRCSVSYIPLCNNKKEHWSKSV